MKDTPGPGVHPFAVITAAALARLAIAAIVPLVPDEAYYWDWSRHIAAGYFDHPPLIAFLIRVGTAIFGDTPFGVRAGTHVMGFAATAAGVALANRLGGPTAAWRAALITVAMPLAGVGLVLATPDVPLLCGSAVALWAVDHAIDGTERHALTWWVVAGLAIGLAFDAKYSAVLVAAGIAVALALHPALREQWRTPGPYMATAIAILIALPVVRWNAQHGWISFRFQLQHGLGPTRGSVLQRELELIGAQAALVSPVLFVLQVGAVGRALTKRLSPRLFMLAIVATVITVFFVWSARHRVSANWLAPAVLPSAVLLAALPAGPTLRRWERVGVTLGGAMVVAIYVHAVHTILPLRPSADPIGQAFGWDELARAVDARPTTWVAADRYQDAAELAFHLPGHPTVFALNAGGRHNQYDLWPTLRDRARLGDTVTVVLDERDQPPPAVAVLTPHFAAVARGDLIEMHRGTAVVARRRLWHFTRLVSPL